MKNRIPQAFFPILLIIMIGTICVYGIVTNSTTDYGKHSEARNVYSEFNRQQKQYIKEKSIISIYVDPNLRYLMNEDGTGYLWDYMNSILKPAGITFDLTDDMDTADCSLMVINDELREKSTEVDYTAPLFQVDGAVFARENTEASEELDGVIMEGRLSGSETAAIKYDGNSVEFVEADTAEEAVEKA
ncbi:MAG: hypothetical protein ACI4LD_04530, partial [Lentihominibacter sp.]